MVSHQQTTSQDSVLATVPFPQYPRQSGNREQSLFDEKFIHLIVTSWLGLGSWGQRWGREERKRKGRHTEVLQSPSSTYPQWLEDHKLSPISQKFTPPLEITKLTNEIWHMGLPGMLQIHSTARPDHKQFNSFQHLSLCSLSSTSLNA